MLAIAICFAFLPLPVWAGGVGDFRVAAGAVELIYHLSNGLLENLTTEKGQKRQSIPFGKVTDILNL